MKRLVRLTASIPALDDADAEVVGYYYPADPGRLSGPPERCYPPEPADFDLLELWLDGVDLVKLSGEEFSSRFPGVDWWLVADQVSEIAMQWCEED